MSLCTDVSSNRGTTVAPQIGIDKIPERVKLALLFPCLGDKDLANLCASKKVWQAKLKNVQESDSDSMKSVRLSIRMARMNWICERNPEFSQLLGCLH
jgi:hypothetical protein